MKKSATQPAVDTAMKKQLQGVVVSNKMKDTVVVEVQRFFKHPKYKKFISRSKKFMAHDAGNTKKVGDEVTIEETRPMSRHKHFIVVAAK
jgi:small subunit ribosomal protein S17